MVVEQGDWEGKLAGINNFYSRTQALLPSKRHKIGNFPITELDEVGY